MPAAADIRKKRLLYRSWHRGTRESDLIMGRFADAYLAGFDADQLDRYEALLECSDADLFDWVAGRAAPPETQDHDVTRLLISFRPAATLPQKTPSPPAEGRGEGEGGALLTEPPLGSPPHPSPLPQGGEGEEFGRRKEAAGRKARPV